MRGEKRKKVVVTLEEKLLAVRRLDSGESAKKIALELGIGKSTVGDWKKNRVEIEKWCSNQASGSGIKARKTMRKGEHLKVEEALFLWHEHVRRLGLPVLGPLLKEKALQFHKLIEGETSEFTASEGWLARWKKRFGVRQLTISGELSANKNSVGHFKKELFKLMDKEGITSDQIYNCNEKGLNYKLLPTKTLASRREAAALGYKKSKERVTVLACSNATGNHKLRLMLIGKSKKPRAFKNLQNMESFPVWYTHQQKAQMNSDIFCQWFKKEFVPSVENYLQDNNLPRKAILILDNASSHPANETLQDGDIKALFLPPNVTSLCQPMNQGVLEALKKKYRQRLLTCLITAIDDDEDWIDMLNKVDMLDVISWISEGWEEITSLSLVRSWKKLLDHKASGEEAEGSENEINSEDTTLISLLEKLPGCELADIEDIKEWMANDEIEEFTDDDIVQMVTNDTEDDRPNKISHAKGCKVIEAALDYISQQDEVTPADIICLRKWKDIAARKKMQRQKQTTEKFFKK